MKLLLDTHVWLWSLLEPGRLAPAARRELARQDNELWLSPISVWESLVLHRKGRVDLGSDPFAWIETALSRVPMMEAPITTSVSLLSERLAWPWRDPADLFLAATAMIYDLTLVSRDVHFRHKKDLRILKA